MKVQKTVSQRLARAGDGPWSCDLEMGEGSRSAQRRAHISTDILGCPASTRAIAAVNVAHVHMCSCGTNRPLPSARYDGAFRRHTEQKHLPVHIYLHAYGVYISQLIRYARACSNYSDFLERHKHLCTRLLSQEYEEMRLKRSLTKFFFKYQDLVDKYSVSSTIIIEDCFL